jgi:hypothetical protein
MTSRLWFLDEENNVMSEPFDDGLHPVPTQTPTLGEQRVRATLSDYPLVKLIKRKSAELIDDCEKMRVLNKDPRCIALAQKAYEEAAMWAVKAATS